MIRLNLSRGPQWLDLGNGIEVLVLPLTTAMIAMARESDLRTDLPDEAGIDRKLAALTAAVARLAITDWRGICLAEGDDPAPVTPETIDAVMDIYPVSQAFYGRYIASGLVLVAEKKGLAPLQNGTSAGAPTIAETATGSAPPARAGKTRRKH